MTDTLHLSKRLTTIASFLPQGAYFADIGSDHAYLPCYVCLHDQKARAIAGEVNMGPYTSACKTVEAYQLNDRIKVRLGDGLKVIADEEVSQIIIAGMGGSLISKILKDGSQYVNGVERIITQPNIGEKNVRSWLLDNHFSLKVETIVEENEHFYEVIVADKGENDILYTEQDKEKQLYFGPLLLKEKSPTFIKKWTFQKKKLEQILTQIQQAAHQDQEKINQLTKEIQWIKEVIDDE